MYRYSRTLLFFILLWLSAPALFAQFGQNKVQYENFNWHYLQSKHFDIYFYAGGYDIGEFTANVAESAYVHLKQDFQYELSRRVKIILYNSHNDFQQTNVVDVYLYEGIGGVTELYKNRVVLPYEGNFAQLRHVIHHELVHAVMNDMLYGGSVQSLISGQVVPVPTWFAEGLAEYFSLRWDTRTDMIVRDAAISGYLPPIEILNYYLAYQGGASVFRYIAERYGHEKIAELLHKVKGSYRIENAFKAALGIELEELSNDWQKAMRKEYWPDIANRTEVKSIARAMTDHKKEKNYLNVSPAISPNGDKMVFLSDREGKQSIYLYDVIESKVIRKLVEGEASVNFEELHWLSPGMSWSPDGRKVTFAAKAGDQDALYIYDTETDKTRQFKFNLDGIFSADWSPLGDKIAFVGNNNGASDIYLFDVASDTITNITRDVFSETYPAWSKDGQSIVFVSDRGAHTSGMPEEQRFDISLHNFENTDIYLMRADGTDIRRITTDENRDSEPEFSGDGKSIYYVSDRTGIYNIYRYNLESGEDYAITDLLTGAFQLNLDKSGTNMVFTTFSEGGWDIYSMKNPDKTGPVQPEKTVFFKNRQERTDIYYPTVKTQTGFTADSVASALPVDKSNDYSHYVFANMKQPRKKAEPEERKLKEEDFKTGDGHYKVRNYQVRFSPDQVDGAVQYDTYWGLQGFTQLAFSDVLGNHKIYLGTNLVFDLRNSYITADYWYLPKRFDFGLHGFHFGNTFILSNHEVYRYRFYGINAIVSYPLNKFTRFEASLNQFNVDLENLQSDDPPESVRSILPTLQITHDTAEWGYSGPMDGFRGLLRVTASPKYTSNAPQFVTVQTDLRKYFKITDNYALAFRIHAGGSEGSDPQHFFLGGTSNWLNRDYKGGLKIDDIKDVYFSEFVLPLRGARYYERVGNYFTLINSEFRFPMIPYMELGFPPIRLGNIQGVFFTDAGSAWDSTKPFKGAENGVLKDIVAGYGFGTRIYLFGLLLKYDMAWRYDLENSSRPNHYISFGIDF